jgi:hypothetical protein
MKKTILFLFLISFLYLTFSSKVVAQAAGTSTPTLGTGTNQPNSTPSATYTPSVTPSITPTTTLMPLPAITLIFPATTATLTPTITPTPVQVTETPRATVAGDVASLSPRIKLIIGFVILLWLILALFVILYIRQFR